MRTWFGVHFQRTYIRDTNPMLQEAKSVKKKTYRPLQNENSGIGRACPGINPIISEDMKG